MAEKNESFWEDLVQAIVAKEDLELLLALLNAVPSQENVGPNVRAVEPLAN